MVDDTPQRTLNTDIGTLRQAHNLFFTPSAEGRDFNSVLQEVQEYISGAYAALITGGGEDSKEQLMRYITKYLQDRRIAVAGMTQTELVDAIYSEMAEFGFLTRYIYADGIEEININSWRDIEVQYSDGRSEKLTEHFDSPEHALAVIRRMLHASGMVLDNASPLVTGHLTRNTRIAAMKSPVVDEDVGVAASIRIVNRHNLSREDLLRSGTATAEMLDWLSVFLRYGISICVAGATSSGKTTAAGWLLTTIPDSKRIFTIENGSRELGGRDARPGGQCGAGGRPCRRGGADYHPLQLLRGDLPPNGVPLQTSRGYVGRNASQLCDGGIPHRGLLQAVGK